MWGCKISEKKTEAWKGRLKVDDKREKEIRKATRKRK